MRHLAIPKMESITVPTGINSLDLSLGGGLQSQRFTLVYGHNGTGKSMFLAQAVCSLQKSESCKNKCSFIFQSCKPLCTTVIQRVGKHWGLDDPLSNIGLAHPGSLLELKQQLDFFRDLLDRKNNNYGLIAIDGIGGLLSTSEDYLDRARLLTDICVTLREIMEDHPIHVIVITNMQQGFDDRKQEYAAGSHILNSYATCLLHFKKETNGNKQQRQVELVRGIMCIPVKVNIVISFFGIFSQEC